MKIYCTPVGMSHVSKLLAETYPTIDFVFQGGVRGKYETEEILRPERFAIVGSETIDASFLAKSSLRAIARFGGGLDGIDIGAAKDLGIKVFSFKSHQVISDVTNLTISFILAASFDLFEHDKNLKQGLWRRPSYAGAATAIKVLGSGNIGKLVVSRLSSLGFKDVGLVSVRSLCNGHSVEKRLREEIGNANIIVITGSPIDWPKEQFMKCIASNRNLTAVINTARGVLVDEERLESLLTKSDHIRYYTDVLTHEPPLCTSISLISRPNFHGTPHIGGYSESSLEEVAIKCVDFLLEQNHGD